MEIGNRHLDGRTKSKDLSYLADMVSSVASKRNKKALRSIGHGKH
jgi:hypothetical protein